ncbi:Uncharacterised protein [Mycobacteroides abscessus subsp. abscessus]|nr:Uncharacterised protein [Mycobacteroides abscessus subsp. abscessus]
MRLALPRLRASIMMSCSISQVFSGAGCDCRTNASQPRTDSSNRTKISPLAKSRAVCAVTWTSSSLATCSANSGCARPENSIRFLRLSVQSVLTAQLVLLVWVVSWALNRAGRVPPVGVMVRTFPGRPGGGCRNLNARCPTWVLDGQEPLDASSAALAASEPGRFCATQPSMLRWRPADTASAPGGTSSRMTVPAPV